MAVRVPVTEEDLQRELFRRRGGLYRFMKAAWSEVESAEFVDNWHLEEVCKHLEAVSLGEISRLILNIPPGCTKSLLVSVFWPVWDWAVINSGRRWMFASFDAALSQRDALRAKELIRSDWFQARFGVECSEALALLGLSPCQVLTDSANKQNTATIYWVLGGGLRFSTSVSGKSTGWHAHIQVVDDPIKPQDLQGGGQKARNALDKTDFWWSTTMASRKATPVSFARVVMMQRLHAGDLAGREIARGGYVVLSLPMRYDAKRPCRTMWRTAEGRVVMGGDRRTKHGELLWPERYPDGEVARTEKELGPQAARAQLQQDPATESGSIFKRHYLANRYKAIPSGAEWLASWDCTFDDTEGSDYVVGTVWAFTGAQFYLVDLVRARMDFPSTAAAIRDLKAKWPRVRKVLVESKANGPAVIKALKKTVPGLIGWNPGSDSKEARAHASSGYFEAGDVLLPDDAPWVTDYIEELTQFPKGTLDDQVDSTTQAILYLTDPEGRKRNRLREAMERLD